MSRNIKVLELSSEEMAKLTLGYKDSSNFHFSRRCHIILLKGTGRTSKDIASILGITDQSVNNWVKRFSSTGVEGLLTKPGQGRRAILDKETDAQKVRETVEGERQRLKLAREGLEEELGKKFSTKTLSRFLKLLAARTDGLGQGPRANPMSNYMKSVKKPWGYSKSKVGKETLSFFMGTELVFPKKVLYPTDGSSRTSKCASKSKKDDRSTCLA